MSNTPEKDTLPRDPWSVTVLTLFPDLFPGPLGQSVTGRALKQGIWSLNPVDIRVGSVDAYQTVDDAPFGGGAGMVLKPDVVGRALNKAVGAEGTGDTLPESRNPTDKKIIYLSPKGRCFNQVCARELSAHQPGLVLLCGRYEGVDQRVLDEWAVDEISLGDFILTGGELAAYSLIDAAVRLLPGVLGKEESFQNETFEQNLLEHSHYTRPQDWQGRLVPSVLVSGNHQKIDEWRKQEAEKLTQDRRPDLWDCYLKNNKQ